MNFLSKNVSSNFTIATCFAIVFLLFVQSISACSWDYLIWQNRQKNSDPYYRFIRNGKAGFIDKTGKIVIEPKLLALGNYQSGIINGLLNVNWGKYVDIQTGKEVSAEFYEKKTKIPEELSAEIIGNNFGNNFGFSDVNGNTIIEPKFIYAKSFSEGFAPVVVDGPCFYYSSEAACPGAAFFPIGTKAQPTDACRFNFIDKMGNFISSQTFLDVKEFSEGLAPVKTADGWGYIDKTGKIIIKPHFEEASPFSDGLGLIKLNNLYGYVNSTGDFVIKPKFNSAISFANNLAPVGNYKDKMTDNEFYFITKTGKPAFPGKFLLASEYFKGIAHVLVSETLKTEKKDDKEQEIRTRTYAYINEKGEKIFVYSIEDEM